MSDRLVKEVITTTTERFHENGAIKEKITESREKVYDYGYSEKQISEAVEEKPAKAIETQETTPKEDTPKEDSTAELIKAVSQKIDQNQANYVEEVPQAAAVAPQVAVPQYNVVGRGPQATETNMPKPVLFPWEKH